jgi:hypothetical protein
VTLSPESAIVRYLLMLSLTGLFVAPAALAMLISLFVLLASGEVRIYGSTESFRPLLGHDFQSGSHRRLALAWHVYGIREGNRTSGPWTVALSGWFPPETMLTNGLTWILTGLDILCSVVIIDYSMISAVSCSVFPAVVGAFVLRSWSPEYFTKSVAPAVPDR